MTPEREKAYADACDEAIRSEVVTRALAERRSLLVATLVQNGFALTSPAPCEMVQSTAREHFLFAEASIWDALSEQVLTVRSGLELSRDPEDFGQAFGFWEVRRPEDGDAPGRRDAFSLAGRPLFTAMAIDPARRMSELTPLLVTHLRDHADLADADWLRNMARVTAGDLLDALAP